MSFTVEISTGNAAFEDNEAREVARILLSLVETLQRLDGLPAHISLYDLNGNKVGFAQEEQEESEPEPCPIHRQPLSRCGCRF